MIVYWVPGMTLASGYYADLNLYYFAMLGVLLGAARPVTSASSLLRAPGAT